MKNKPKKKAAKKQETFKSDLRLKIEYLDPTTLKLWEKNPRLNDKAAEKVAAVIKIHDFGVPVTMRAEDGIIYKGNTRVKAARLLGMDVIPVMRRSYPEIEKAKRDALADNRAQEAAQWDEDALSAMFQERKEVDLDQLAAETGFEAVEIKGLRDGFSVPDEAEGRVTGKHSRGDFAGKCPHCGHEGAVQCTSCKKEFDL